MGILSFTLCFIVSVMAAYVVRRLFNLGTISYFSFIVVCMLLLQSISGYLASWWDVTKAESLEEIINSLDLKSGDIMLDTKNGFHMLTQQDVQAGKSLEDGGHQVTTASKQLSTKRRLDDEGVAY